MEVNPKNSDDRVLIAIVALNTTGNSQSSVEINRKANNRRLITNFKISKKTINVTVFERLKQM